jgi:NADH:ubiquinone oxidoreductase subunit F (NADH-binding)
VKLSVVAAARRPIVVANATEGEPASAKDKTLLAVAPHLVLDGAVVAAEAVGASEAIVCVERTATKAVRAVESAIVERRAQGIDGVRLQLAQTPDRYVVGEESALVHWLNGGEAKPTIVPPRVFEKGVGGRPTLVQNVETLANIALIARFGADWFRTVGTDADAGSTLVTVSGGVARPGVYEVALGISLGEVLRAAGAVPGEVMAVLAGGYFGSWIPSGAIGKLTLTVDSLRTVDARLGSGVLAVLPTSSCGLVESARVARWLSDQTAGQCGPCVNGLAAIAGAMEVLVRGDVDGLAERQLSRWVEVVKGRGACKHPDGAAHFVESSLRVFAGEIADHRRAGPCAGSRAPALLPVPSPGGWR